jgi:hypothetical protein
MRIRAILAATAAALTATAAVALPLAPRPAG